ncbi:unnamed protein product [Gordionus sp. m RMFG-2023]
MTRPTCYHPRMKTILRDLPLLFKFTKRIWIFLLQLIFLLIIFPLSNKHTCHAFLGNLTTINKIKTSTALPKDGVVIDLSRDHQFPDKTTWNYSDYSESTNTTSRFNPIYETVDFEITLSEDTQIKTECNSEYWNLGKVFLNRIPKVNKSTILMYKLDKQITNIMPIKIRRNGRLVIINVSRFLAAPSMTTYKFFVKVYRRRKPAKNLSPEINQRRTYSLLNIFWVRISIDFCGSSLKINPVSSINSAINKQKLKPPLKGAVSAPWIDKLMRNVAFSSKSYNYSIPEHFKDLIDVGDARAVCGAGGCNPINIAYNLGNNDYFSLDKSRGNKLRILVADLNYQQLFSNGKTPILSVQMIANFNSDHAECTLNIKIIDINDNSPIFVKPYRAEIANDYSVKAEVIKAIAEDIDFGDNGKIFYMIKDADDMFDIDNITGTIYVTSPLNLEKRVSLNVEVFAYDKGRPWKYSSAIVDIRLNHTINQYPPVFDHNYYGTSCFEDIRTGAIIIRVHAFDPDYEDVPLNWKSITNFNIRKVRHLPSLRSPRGNITGQKFIKNSSIFGRKNTLNKRGIYNTYKKPKRDEPSGRGNVVAIYYSIVGDNDNGVFAIDSKMGDIKTIAKLDAETKSYYELVVQATDEGGSGLKTTVIVYIQVKDINDNPPEIIGPAQALGVSVNAKPGDLVYVVKAIDKDISNNPIDPVTLKEGLPAPSFSFEPATGEIKVASTSLQPGEETLTIEAKDKGTPPLTSSLSIPIKMFLVEAAKGSSQTPSLLTKEKMENEKRGKDDKGKDDKGADKDKAKTTTLKAVPGLPPPPGGAPIRPPEPGMDGKLPLGPSPPPGKGLAVPPPPPGTRPADPSPALGARPTGPPPPPGARPAAPPPPGAIAGARLSGAAHVRPPMPPGTAPPLNPGGPPKSMDLSKPPSTAVPATAKPPVFAGALPPLKDNTIAYTDDADKSYGYDYNYGYDTSQYGASEYAYSADPYYNYNYGDYYDDYDSKYTYDDNYAYSYGGDDYNSDAYGYGADPYYDYNYNDYYGGDYSDYYSGGDYGSYGGIDASGTYGGEYSVYDSSAYGSGASTAYGSDAYGTDAYGSTAPGSDAYGSTAYGTDAYGSGAPSSDAYGSSAYGTDAYGSTAAGSDAYGSSAYGTEGSTTYGTDESTSYGTNAYGSTVYDASGASKGSENSVATDQYASSTYDGID